MANTSTFTGETAPTQANNGGRVPKMTPAAPATRTVPVKAHTRTVPAKPAPPQSSLPPTSDKPVSHTANSGGFYTYQADARKAAQNGQAVGYMPGKGFYLRGAPQTQRASDPYSSLLLYPNQTPEQLANAALAPQYTQINSQQHADQAALQGFAKAMLAQLGNYPAQVGQDYQQAADQINGYGTQAANLLASLDPNASNQSLLHAAGAAAAQGTQLAGQNQANFGGAGANLYTNEAAVPAQSLEQQKAAALAYAQGLPGVQSLAAIQAAKNLIYQGDQNRLKVAEQYPGLVSQFGTAKADSAAKVAALDQNAAALGLKQASTAFNQNLAVSKLNQKQSQFIAAQRWRIKQFNATQATAAGRLALPNASLSRAKGVLVDQTGKVIPGANGKPQVLPGFRMNPDGAVVKVTSAKKIAQPTPSNPFPNLSQKQVQSLRSGIANAFYGTKEQKDASGKVVSPALPQLSYQQAIHEAVVHGYSRAAATRMANRFYMPGRRGRPGKTRKNA